MSLENISLSLIQINRLVTFLVKDLLQFEFDTVSSASKKVNHTIFECLLFSGFHFIEMKKSGTGKRKLKSRKCSNMFMIPSIKTFRFESVENTQLMMHVVVISMVTEKATPMIRATIGPIDVANKTQLSIV